MTGHCSRLPGILTNDTAGSVLHSNMHTYISIWGWWSERSLSIPELPTLRLLACDTCFNLCSHDFIVQTNVIPNNKEPLKASTYQKCVSFLVLISDFFSAWSTDIRESSTQFTCFVCESSANAIIRLPDVPEDFCLCSVQVCSCPVENSSSIL